MIHLLYTLLHSSTRLIPQQLDIPDIQHVNVNMPACIPCFSHLSEGLAFMPACYPWSSCLLVFSPSFTAQTPVGCCQLIFGLPACYPWWACTIPNALWLGGGYEVLVDSDGVDLPEAALDTLLLLVVQSIKDLDNINSKWKRCLGWYCTRQITPNSNFLRLLLEAISV